MTQDAFYEGQPIRIACTNQLNTQRANDCTCSGCDQLHVEACPVCGSRRATFGLKHYDRLLQAIRDVQRLVTDADVLFEPGGGLNSEEHVRWERAIDALHALQAAAKLPG